MLECVCICSFVWEISIQHDYESNCQSFRGKVSCNSGLICLQWLGLGPRAWVWPRTSRYWTPSNHFEIRWTFWVPRLFCRPCVMSDQNRQLWWPERSREGSQKNRHHRKRTLWKVLDNVMPQGTMAGWTLSSKKVPSSSPRQSSPPFCMAVPRLQTRNNAGLCCTSS